jgi:hypothetical protein
VGRLHPRRVRLPVAAVCDRRSPTTDLRIATSTIKIYLEPIFEKLGVDHRLGAALYASEFFPNEDMAASEPD